MLMDWINWLLVIVAAVLGVLLFVDAVFVEIPWVRKFRGAIGGVIVFLGGAVVGRGLSSGSGESPSEPPPNSPVASPEPEVFDDEPERKTDAEADDLDLETAAADRDLGELADSNDSNRADLDDLLREVEEGGEDREDGAGERGGGPEAGRGSDEA